MSIQIKDYPMFSTFLNDAKAEYPDLNVEEVIFKSEAKFWKPIKSSLKNRLVRAAD